MVRIHTLGIVLILSIWLLGCGGGGGSTSNTSQGFDHITVAEVNQIISDRGGQYSNTYVAHDDGFGNGGVRVDIGRVVLTRINGGSFNNDVFYSFDVKYIGNETNYPNDITPVLYLDTDLNTSTGMLINGIGADVRLTNTGSSNTLTSGYCKWNSNNNNWSDEIYLGSSSGSADDGKYVSGGAHVYVAIYGTSSLLKTDAKGVLALEILTNDNYSMSFRYDMTDNFNIYGF